MTRNGPWLGGSHSLVSERVLLQERSQLAACKSPRKSQSIQTKLASSQKSPPREQSISFRKWAFRGIGSGMGLWVLAVLGAGGVLVFEAGLCRGIADLESALTCIIPICKLL